MHLKQILYEFLSKKCSTEITKLFKLYYENSFFLLSSYCHIRYLWDAHSGFFASLLLCFFASLLQKSSKIEWKINEKWSKNQLKINQKWSKNRSKMDQKSIKNRPKFQENKESEITACEIRTRTGNHSLWNQKTGRKSQPVKSDEIFLLIPRARKYQKHRKGGVRPRAGHGRGFRSRALNYHLPKRKKNKATKDERRKTKDERRKTKNSYSRRRAERGGGYSNQLTCIETY